MEARADVLMIQMAGSNFDVKEYLKFWKDHLKKLGRSSFNKDAFLYRFCFVLAYFEEVNGKFNDVVIDDFVNEWPCFKELFHLYSIFKWIAVPFNEHVKKWQNPVDGDGRTLFERLNEKWQMRTSLPPYFELNEQIAFYVNHWFNDLMEAEMQISSDV